MIKMKGLSVLISLALLLGVSCISCSRFPNKINSLFKTKFHKSVALLQSTPGEKGFRGGTATGFAIDGQHLLTAGHFCEATVELNKKGMVGEKILIVRSNSKGLPRIPVLGTIVGHDSKTDICVIKSPDHKMEALPLADSVSEIRTEDVVTVIGAPNGFFPVRRDGRIISTLAYRFQQFSDMLFISINIQAGNSGSPVIMHGEVVGMIVIQPLTIHETALAVPVDEIRKFIKKTIAK
jgi:S1-C subfamily serine protease